MSLAGICRIIPDICKNDNVFSDRVFVLLMFSNGRESEVAKLLSWCAFNPINPGLLALELTLGGGVFHPPSITPLSLKLDCSNFAQSYFQTR